MCPSVTFCFINILKSHYWNFIKPFQTCSYIYKTNTLNNKVRARGQNCMMNCWYSELPGKLECIVVLTFINSGGPGRLAQSVTCLATDAYLTADPGVASSIPARSHTFVEIDHSPPFRWIIQEGLLSVTSESMCTKYWLTACSSLPRKKSVVRWTDRPAMTIAVDLGRKATKQTNKQINSGGTAHKSSSTVQNCAIEVES